MVPLRFVGPQSASASLLGGAGSWGCLGNKPAMVAGLMPHVAVASAGSPGIWGDFRAVPGPGHAYCTPEGRDKRVRSCGRPTAVGRRLGLAGAPRARPQGRELCSRASSGWFPAVAGTPRQPEPGPRTCVCAELRLSARGGGGCFWFSDKLLMDTTWELVCFKEGIYTPPMQKASYYPSHGTCETSFAYPDWQSGGCKPKWRGGGS